MQADMKALWVEALRSGSYKQTQRILRSEWDGFCCLGVLCDLYDPKKWVKRYYGYEYHGTAEDGSTYIRTGGLPHNVVKDLNLCYQNETELVSMNDRGVPFAEIADWIEANM